MEPTLTDEPKASETTMTGEPEAAPPAIPAARLSTNASLLHTPLSHAPPLSATAAWTGLIALFLMRFLMPSRDPQTSTPATWELIARMGTFAVNLAAIASMVALVLGVQPWLRQSPLVTTRGRLLIATFGGMLLPVWLRAVFFPRESMNGALSSLGAATAFSLSVLLVLSAIRNVRARPQQLLPVVLFSVSVMCALGLLTLQAVSIVAPFSAVHRAVWLVSEMGEGAYLGVMLCAVTLLPPRPWAWRDRIALGIGLLMLLVVAATFELAVVALGREFAIALYYAQHVTWFLDGAIWLYAIPLSIGLGAATTATLGNDPHRRQLAIAVLCWIAAGYAPRAPWRFSLLALSGALIARAVAARTMLPAPGSPSASDSPSSIGPSVADPDEASSTTQV